MARACRPAPLERYHDALSKLVRVDDNGVVYDQFGRPWDREGFAHFKFGWLPYARRIARQMADEIALHLWKLAQGRRILIVSAPYKFLPTASHAIADYLRQELAIRAIKEGIEPPVLVPFHKDKAGDSSYAKGDLALREATLASLGLHIDESLIPGSVILVVDDIKVFGTAEKATANYLEPLRPFAIWYLHGAQVSDALAHSIEGFENQLNDSVAHTPDVILEQVKMGEFRLNTRVLRHLLELPYLEFNLFVRM